MTTWRVHKVISGRVSQDGSEVYVSLECGNGAKNVLECPYDQLDWLNQALLQLATGAFQRQVQGGKLTLTKNAIATSMTVEGFRVLPELNGEQAIVQLHGRAGASSPLGMGSFQIERGQMRDLAARLFEVADDLDQRSKPLS